MNRYRFSFWSIPRLKASLFWVLLISWMAGPVAFGTLNIDPISNPGLSGTVRAIASVAGGRIIIGGDFDLKPGSTEWAGIARLNANGTIDTTFPSQSGSNVNDIAIQPADQKVVVAGDFYDSATGNTFHIRRFNVSGSNDSSFSVPAGLDDAVNSVVVLSGGKILIGGAFTTADGSAGHGYHLARLNANGTLDLTFNLRADGIVRKLVVQADGSVLVGGEFQKLGGAPHHGIARLTPAGALDSGFNASAENGSVESLAVQPDKKILVGGLFDTLCGQPRSYIGRLNPDGTLDTAFDPGSDGEINNLVARTNGKILVSGYFNTLSGQSFGSYVTQLLPNGRVDETFAVVSDGPVDHIATPAPGKIWLGGEFSSLSDANGSVDVACIGSLTDSAPSLVSGSSAVLSSLTVSSGTLSPVFTATGTSYRLTAHTKAINVTPVSGDSNALIQVRLNGGAYATVASNTASADLPMAVTSGTIEVRVIAANGTAMKTYTVKASRSAIADANLSQLEPGNNFTLNQPFDSGTTSYSATVASRSITVIPTVEDATATVSVAVNSASFSTVVSGASSGDLPLNMGINVVYVKVLAEDGTTQKLYAIAVTRTPASDASLSALMVDGGTLDPAFDPTTLSYQTTVYSTTTRVTPFTADPNATVQVQVNGAGYFPVGSGAGSDLVPLADGANHIDVLVTAEDGATQETYGIDVTRVHSVADGFNPQMSGTVNAVAIQPDGRIVFGGDFTTVAGQARQRIARFNIDGTLDPTFNPGADDVVQAIAIQADGKILVGGYFSTLGGQRCAYLGRLNSDGSPDVYFTAGADAAVTCLAVQPADGKILVGGYFSNLGGNGRIGIGRLDASGDLDLNFHPDATLQVSFGTVNCLAVQTNGQILVGGDFDTLGGQPRNHVGRLNTGGDPDLSFDPGADYVVNCIAEQPADGKILAGGQFTTLAGNSCNYVARLNADGSFDLDLGQLAQGAYAPVNCLAVQPDGKIVVGGAFYWSDPVSGGQCYNIGRLNGDGTLDADFFPGANGPVNSLALQSNGKIVVGGAFTSLGGVSRQGIGRLESFGTASSDATLSNLTLSNTPLDQPFDSGTTHYAATAISGAIAITPVASDSNALIQVRVNGGNYSIVNSGSASGMLPLNSGSNVVEVRVTADDDSTVRTYSITVTRGLIADANLSSLTLSNAALDQPFDAGTTTYTATVAYGSTAVIPTTEDVTATVVVSVNGSAPIPVASGSQSNPLPLLGGSNNIIAVTVTAETGATKTYTITVTRQPGSNADLENLSVGNWPLTPGFVTGGTAYSATVISGSALITPTTVDPNATLQIRVNNGVWNPAPSGVATVLTSLAMGDNTIELRVTSASGNGVKTYTITATRVHSAADPFDPGALSTNGGVYGLAVQGDGKILVGGAFQTLAGRACSNFGRLTVDGSLDSSFQPVFNSTVACVAVQQDQKILVGGYFGMVNRLQHNCLVRLSGSGTVDATFNPVFGSAQYASPTIRSIVVQPGDGKILVGGEFDTVGGALHKNLARLSGSGTVDSTFAPGADGQVYCVVLQPDGKILVGGNFNNLGGQARHYMARLNANGTIDSTFQGVANSTVTSLALQADGKILVGGYFDHLSGYSQAGLGRLNTNGTLDLSFTAGVDSGVSCLLVQADGRILVGGVFQTLAGQPCNRIGRIWPNGVLDTAFNGGADAWVSCLARQQDGKIIAGGAFTVLGGQPRMHIGRLMDDGAASVVASNNADLSALLVSSGTLSPVFSGTYNKPYTVKALTSSFSVFPTSQDPNALILAQLNGGGYAPVVSGSVGWPIHVGSNTVILQVIAANGAVSKSTALTVSRVAASDADLSALALSNGTLSPSFKRGVVQYSGTVSGGVTSITAVTDDYTATVQARVNSGVYQVLHSGTAGAPLALKSGSNHVEVKVTAEDLHTVKTYQMDVIRVASSNADLTGLRLVGSPFDFASDTTDYNVNLFGETVTMAPLSSDTNATIRVQVNGGIWVTLPRGSKTTQIPLNLGYNTVEVRVIAEDGLSVKTYTLNITSTVCGCDSGFNPTAGDGVWSLALQKDGRILVGGRSYPANAQPRSIGRFNTNGTADAAFNHGGAIGDNEASVDAVAVQADGKSVVGGMFSWMCGQPRANIARLNADGSLDATFNPGTDGEVYCIAIQPNGKILIGGQFTTVGGKPYRNLARLNANGTVDATFANPVPDDVVWCLAAQADGSFLAGGAFTVIGGQSISRLARFGSDGVLDPNFAPNPDSVVACIAVQPDGNILAGGSFYNIGGEVHNDLARLWPDGTPDSNFTPNVDDSVYSVALQANGKILIGGYFLNVTTDGNSQPRERIARLNADGTLDPSFDPGADNLVTSIGVQADGKIVVGGWFTSLAGQPHAYLARLVDSGTNANLSSLTLSGATLSPVFTGTNTAYRAAASHGSIAIKPVTVDPAATVKVIVNSSYAVSVASGSLSSPLQLIAGDNIVEVKVTAENGLVTNSYFLTATLMVAPAANPVVGLSSTAVTLNAVVNGGITSGSGSATSFFFQYGPTTTYGSMTTPQSINGGATLATTNLGGLTPGTIYHYRPVVTTGTTAYYGDDQVFATTRFFIDRIMAQNGDVPGWDGVKFAALGIPALNTPGDYAFHTTLAGPGIATTNNSSILVSQSSTLVTLANTGDDASGIDAIFGTGGVFTSLGDPVYNDDGNAVFMGAFKTWVTSGTGVWAWSPDLTLQTSGSLALVAATTQLAPGCEPARFGAFRKIALAGSGDGVFLLADLVSGTGSNPNAAAGQGIWGGVAGGTLNLIARTGSGGLVPLTGTNQVASISAFGGSVGQTRSFNYGGSIVFAVTYADGSQGVFEVTPSLGVSAVAQSGSNYTAFGCPSVNDYDEVAFQARMSGSNSGIWVDSGSTSQLLAATSGTAPGTGGGIFATFGDPLFNNDNTAFLGNLKIGVAGVTAANASGIWLAGSDLVPGLVAQANGADQVPGVPSGARFLSFTQLALPDGNGVVFLGNLATGPGGVTASNNQGLWSMDSNGNLNLVMQKGDGLVSNGIGKTIASMDFLGASPEVSAQSRSFNSSGNLMLKVTFTDNTQAIFEVWLWYPQ